MLQLSAIHASISSGIFKEQEMPGKPTSEAKRAYRLYQGGMAMGTACAKAGVHISTLYRWIEKFGSVTKKAKRNA